MKNNAFQILLLFLYISAITISCSETNLETTYVVPQFHIVILEKDISPFSNSLGQDLESSWPILKDAYHSKVNYIITEEDIRIYNWSAQIVTLSKLGTENLLRNSNIVLDKKSIDYLYGRAFVVAFDNEPIYGGIFIPDMPFAAAYWYPVIHPSLKDGEISLKILPYRSVTDITMEDDQWQKIKDPKVKEFFTNYGTIVE